MIGKNIKRTLFYLNFQLSYFSIVVRELFGVKRNTIYVFDLDNTLANTWPSLGKNYFPNENYRYRSLSIFINMRKLILNLSNDKTILFLSSRSILVFPATLQWLKDFEIEVSITNLILVEHPERKISILKRLAKKRSVKYIDDLSFGHEKGVVEYYDEIIHRVKNLELSYFGSEVIERINNWRIIK